VPAVLGTATGCEVLRASKPQSINGLEPRIATQRHDTVTVVPQYHRKTPSLAMTVCGASNPVDLPLRLDDASAPPTTPQGPHR
jgi:hypothetical protein